MDATATFNTDEPDPGAAIEVGLKLTVTPAGWPVADKAIAELKPSKAEVEIVDVPLLPCTTDNEPGEADSEKVGDVVLDPVRALMSPVFGLPHPVTRS